MADVSLKDGYAVHLAEIAKASESAPISLKLLDMVAVTGYQRIPVIKLPRVVIPATGDEVVAPGKPLRRGLEW